MGSLIGRGGGCVCMYGSGGLNVGGLKDTVDISQVQSLEPLYK
jgi:hypothetical protein